MKGKINEFSLKLGLLGDSGVGKSSKYNNYNFFYSFILRINLLEMNLLRIVFQL